MQNRHRTEQAIQDLLTTIKAQGLGMWRYRWLGLGIAWAICTAGWLAVFAMSDQYSASARVYVDTENAIEDFLGGIAAPTDVLSEVSVVVREIVSRPNLAEVARNTELDLRARSETEFEALLTSLQSRISVDGNSEGIYSMYFVDSDREKALAVVETLLAAFVEKSLGADRTESEQAQKFLQEQIQEYDDRLTVAENRLATFKRENVAFMPDQRGDYFSRLQSAEGALRITEGSLSLATERRAELARQIAGEDPVFGIMTSSGGQRAASGSAGAKIRDLEIQLEELRLQYTDKHPRISQILDTIELLKAQEAAELQAQAGTSPTTPTQNPLDQNPVYQNMRIQLSNVEVEIASLRAERNQQQREVSELRTLVDTIPQVEAELNRLNRDYDVIKAKHQQLLQQLETANLGEDVSRSVDDVQFRIIDPPYAGTSPVGPNRPVLLSMVLIGGLAAGVAIAFLLNLLKPTFFTNRSVKSTLGIPVLASVSLLQSKAQKRATTIKNVVLHAAALLLFATFTAATIYSDEGSLLVRNLMESAS